MNSAMSFSERLNTSKAALRNGSTVEMLSMHFDGLVSAGEVLEAAAQVCYVCPSLRGVLVQQFLSHHDDHIAAFVGHTLQQLTSEGGLPNGRNA